MQEKTSLEGISRQALARSGASLLLIASTSALALYCWLSRPFQDEGGFSRARLASLSRAQRINIDLAARKIDDTIINPGQSFSFNEKVGPRTSNRGFLDAPVYLDNTTTMASGGGICLVSSLLYKTALESGLEIIDRKAHSRPTATVEPGFDATVAYGQVDLKIGNNTGEPVKLRARTCQDELFVSIEGRFPGSGKTCNLVRREIRTEKDLHVEILREINGKKDSLERVSLDTYSLANYRPPNNL